ncbi:hypothetical protein LDENG_00159770 [Lucifuga dentata]|nr:hypothetical protein LDENG_00159770 [Lucifuga dentata]
MINLIGCPLLLTCMCVERYLAVVRPVLYLRLRKWEYMMTVSAVMWVVTLCFSLSAGFLADMTSSLQPVSVIMSCLFLLMLISLWGVIQSLKQKSPAHTTHQTHSSTKPPPLDPLKRRVVENVLVVVVPAMLSYFPILVLAPIISYMLNYKIHLSNTYCAVFELVLLFPRLGLFIGPLFFLAKARQMCCLSSKGKANAA